MSRESGRSRNGRNSERLAYYWANKEPFVALSEGMRKSVAWKVLTATQRLILLEMLSVYYIVSLGNKAKIGDTGFAFTYSRCTVECSEITFRHSRERFLDIGWFKAPPMIQSTVPGSATLFAPCREWGQYEAIESEARGLKKRAKGKAARLTRDKKCKRDNLMKLKKKGGGTAVIPPPQKLWGYFATEQPCPP
jgi:hypothetical protein